MRKKQFQEKLYPFALLCNFALLLVPLSLFLFLTGPEGSLRESPAAGRCVAVCMQVFLNNEWGVVLSHRLLPTVKRCTDGWHSDLLKLLEPTPPPGIYEGLQKLPPLSILIRPTPDTLFLPLSLSLSLSLSSLSSLLPPVFVLPCSVPPSNAPLASSLSVSSLSQVLLS